MTVEIEQVNARGMALMGVVSALKPSYARDPDLVPPELRKYLDEDVDVERWYPLAAYVALSKILASTIDPEKAGGDVFRAFGVIGAKRDLRGVLDDVPEDQRPKNVGAYRGEIGTALGLSARVRRGLRLRERYYSRGYYRVQRKRERVLHVTLEDFPASPELCRISTGYLVEVFRSPDLGAWVERIKCRADGDGSCVWELRFKDDVDVTSLADFE